MLDRSSQLLNSKLARLTQIFAFSPSTSPLLERQYPSSIFRPRVLGCFGSGRQHHDKLQAAWSAVESLQPRVDDTLFNGEEDISNARRSFEDRGY
jgi:hypothetical protein